MPLPKPLAETLGCLRRSQRGATAEELHVLLINKHGGAFGVTAVSNRLEELRELGFVDRKRHGKFWRYQRTTPNDKPHSTRH